MYVPREILSLVASDNINLYKTCSEFYSHVDIFYKSYEIDLDNIVEKHYEMMRDIFIMQKMTDRMLSYIDILQYMCNNIHIIKNVRNTDYIKNMPNLTHLIFDYSFDKSIDNLRCNQSITHIKFGMQFNQSVDKLPLNLTHINFGWGFNQTTDNLPSKITSIIFGDIFNRPINYLPQRVTHLTLGMSFNQSIERLPKSITHLKLGAKFDKIIKSLPGALEILDIHKDYEKQYVDNILLFQSMTHLKQVNIHNGHGTIIKRIDMKDCKQ